MNRLTIEPKFNKVEIQPQENKANVELIRILTDYPFFSSHQITPEHKEVKS